MIVSRRDFILTTIGGVAAACARPIIGSRSASLRFGYSAITWGNNDLVAINEISDVGYPGIQVRSNTWQHFWRQPSVFRELLSQKNLTFVALSSGAITLEPAREAQMLEEHLAHARFVRDTGGLFLQVTDAPPVDREPTPDDFARLSRLLSILGESTATIGVPLAYHHHMGALGQRPEDIARILAATDARHVKLLLDTAHYQQGGGDPAEAIRTYRDRIALLHLKDVAPAANPAGYRFLELGRGRVNFDAVFSALNQIAFDGWGVVELDGTTEPGRTARESAAINRKYLETRGFRVS
jgi:inosose dehydratase